MTMLFQSFTALVACLALVCARDTAKFMKTVPTISNSLVNLGKMEISFYINGKHQDMPANSDHTMHNDFYSPPPAVEESCQCNNFKLPGPSFSSDPTEIINKILKSNDLFKYSSSSVCCESVEHMQGNTVVFEVNPNNIPSFTTPRNFNNIPTYPKVLQNPIPFHPFFSLNKAGVKPKAVEIFMFPRRKDATFELNNVFKSKQKDPLLKPDVQVVGDKELSFKQPSASVKKDLTLFVKKNKQETAQAPIEDLQTNAPPVTKINNTL